MFLHFAAIQYSSLAYLFHPHFSTAYQLSTVLVPWPYYNSTTCSFTFQYCLSLIYNTCSMNLLQLIHLFLNLYLYCLPIIYSTCSMTLLQLNHLFLHFSVLLISYLQYLFHELTTTHPLVPSLCCYPSYHPVPSLNFLYCTFFHPPVSWNTSNYLQPFFGEKHEK
jgi:hypothetical protein